MTPFASIAEYEAFIFDLRHKQIVPQETTEDIRCDCKVCQELWSAYG